VTDNLSASEIEGEDASTDVPAGAHLEDVDLDVLQDINFDDGELLIIFRRHVELMMFQRTKPTYTGTLDITHKKLSLLPNSARRTLTHRQLLNERQMKPYGSPRDRLTSVMTKTSEPRVFLWLIVRAVSFHVN